MELKAGIIGIGNIGAFIDTPLNTNIASHTKAYLICKKTDLTTVFDTNYSNIEKFKKIWKKDVKIAKNLEDFFDRDIDIVSIASPIQFHFEQLNHALKSEANYILCEKPLVSDIEELEKIETKLLTSKKEILINLIREFSPAFLELKQKIKSEEFGEIVSFEGFCTKGLLHNGIHLITLISSIVSRVNKIEPLSSHTYSKKDEDLNGDFIIRTNTVSGHIKSIKKLDYSEFYLTIWLEKGKIEIKTDEIIYYKKSPSKFIGYNQLERYEIKNNILKNYQLDSIRYLLTCKDTKTILKEHIHNHKVIFETIQKVKNEASN